MKVSARSLIGAGILCAVVGSTFVISAEHVLEPRPMFIVEFTRSGRFSDDTPVVISRAVNALVERPDTRARIVGYAGPGGDVEADMVLSEARANNVAVLLFARGIDPSRVTAMGHGAANGGPQARAEITVSH